MLKFSSANSKLKHLAAIKAFANGDSKIGRTYSFDLPAGYTCPGAQDCWSRAVNTPNGWRIKDGRNCRFRCYAASQEVLLPVVRDLRTHNHNQVRGSRSVRQIADMFHRDIPADCTILRLHTGGDFFNQTYFDGILRFAAKHPHILVYGYTKSIPFWNRRMKEYLSVPNFRLVASLGGRWDSMAREARVRTCKVVLSHEEAERQGLPIDHDDTYALHLRHNGHFAVLIHGTQPAGSVEGKAMYKLRKAKLNGYRKG